jgi:hypothetical protein
MNLSQYQPLNSKESIDRLISDLQNRKLKYSSPQQAEIDCLCEIRKIKLQLYFKEQIAGFSDLHKTEVLINDKKNHSHKENINKPVPKKKKKFPNEKKILVLDDKGSSVIPAEKNSKSKKKKRKKEIVSREVVAHEKYALMTMSELSGELNWRPAVMLKILHYKGIEKNELEILNPDEYSLVKDIIYHRIIQLRRQQKEEEWIFEFSKVKKESKLQFSANRSGVWNEISKYGLGKLIYIRSK